MSKTVYTLNGKVLKNSANDKWMQKKEQAGFVMNASNATISNNIASWEGPNYPDGYDGAGKTLQIIVKEEGFTCGALTFNYTTSTGTASGPSFISGNGAFINPNGIQTPSVSLPVGTYNVSIIQNAAGTGSGYGKYISVIRGGSDTTLDSALLSKLEFRIID